MDSGFRRNDEGGGNDAVNYTPRRLRGGVGAFPADEVGGECSGGVEGAERLKCARKTFVIPAKPLSFPSPLSFPRKRESRKNPSPNANAGNSCRREYGWIPAFAGMTRWRRYPGGNDRPPPPRSFPPPSPMGVENSDPPPASGGGYGGYI